MGNGLFARLIHQLGLGPATPTDEHCLQFPTWQQSAKETPVYLGLDVGTSSSKAVVHLPFVPNAPAFAVPWGGGVNTYLSRTVPANAATGATVSTRQHTPRPNPKVDLLVAPGDVEARAAMALLMSRLMRHARKWFLHEHRKTYGQYRLRWLCRVGVPSTGAKESGLLEAFCLAAHAGWVLSMREGIPGVAVARATLDHVAAQPLAEVEVMPEVAAAVEAYRRSLHARAGMHVMVDIGASTLDLCGFSLQPNSPTQPFTMFMPHVEHLGAAVLHDDRVRCVLEAGQQPGPTAEQDPRDPDFKVPDALDGYVLNGGGVPSYLAAHDGKFIEECEQALRTILVGMYQTNPMAKWPQIALPVFLTGGGARMKLYRQPIQNTVVSRSSYHWSRLDHTAIVQASNLLPKDLPSEVVDRLLVAYGLSMPSGWSGGCGGKGYPPGWGYIDPTNVPAVPAPPRRRLDERYVGKEMT